MTLAQKIRNWLFGCPKCSRCGRELHDRKSIARGMGPECWREYQKEAKGEVEWVSPPIPLSETKKEIEGLMVSPEVAKAVEEGARGATVIRDPSPAPSAYIAEGDVTKGLKTGWKNLEEGD